MMTLHLSPCVASVLLQELQISVAGGAASGASKLPIGMLTCIDQETTEVGLTRQSTIMASSGCKSNVSNIALASGAVCLQAAHALVQCLGSCTEGGTTALMPQKQLRPFFVALLNICVSSVSNGSPGVLWCLLSLSRLFSLLSAAWLSSCVLLCVFVFVFLFFLVVSLSVCLGPRAFRVITLRQLFACAGRP